MNAGRRFSQAVFEGDGISLIARVSGAEDAGRVEAQGAEAVLVVGDTALEAVRAATTLPLVVALAGGHTRPPAAADACLLDASQDLESLTRFYGEVAAACEPALRFSDEENLEEVLEELDPEIFVLAAPEADGEEALEHVLDLLPDVPAGKLAIAELSDSSRDDVGALERAGFDGVIVDAHSVEALAAAPPPEV
jgi:hypothetical protein